MCTGHTCAWTQICRHGDNWESSYPTRLHFLAQIHSPRCGALHPNSAISGQKFRQILNQSVSHIYAGKRLEGLWQVVGVEEASALRPLPVSHPSVAGVRCPPAGTGVPQAGSLQLAAWLGNCQAGVRAHRPCRRRPCRAACIPGS